ncbi:MAG: hypothetical protein IJT75_10765 [Bacteroidaceae bacterium]|nr:hypothetical protein [Bacteroidaceae bacterium]
MEQQKEPIFRSQMLDELDVRYRPDGRRRIFSIKFVTAEGKLIFFPQAYACGAGRMNNKVFRVRGIQACDCLGNPERGIHVYPVRIFNIIQYNGHPVQ